MARLLPAFVEPRRVAVNAAEPAAGVATGRCATAADARAPLAQPRHRIPREGVHEDDTATARAHKKR